MSTDQPGPDNIFGFPFQYWVGMDTDPRTTPEALADFNRFYSTTHVAEVIAAHPGFVAAARYELLDGDSPRWLAIYGMADEAAAERYIKDNARPWLHRQKYSPWPPARRKAKTVWRMLWRVLSASPTVPESIVLLGSNSASSRKGFAELELYREFAHPAPGAPQFCEAFPSGEAPASLEPDAGWRLEYRYIPPA